MNILSKFLTLDFLSPYLGSVLRHLLTAIAGILISLGVITEDQSQNWVDATIPVLVAVGFYAWAQLGSWVSKAKRD